MHVCLCCLQVGQILCAGVTLHISVKSYIHVCSSMKSRELHVYLKHSSKSSPECLEPQLCVDVWTTGMINLS